MKIITHPGSAHRDDFMSVCLVLDQLRFSMYASGAHPMFPSVERKEPSVADLQDPNVWCLDVGLDHCPKLNNFDHHQFERDAAPRCALSLVLEKLGLESAARAASGGWLRFTEIIDCKGPFVACDEYGISRDTLAALESPIESQLLRLWEVNPDSDAIKELMADLGKQWRTYWEKFENRCDLLAETSVYLDLDGTNGVMLVAIDRTDEPTFALEKFILASGKNPSVIVFQDDRGVGHALYRRNDDPRIDFSKIKDDPKIIFAHVNGFIAKTVEGLAVFEIMDLIQKSVVATA